MPDSRMIYKAGKLSFLLVCLFLCIACGKQTAVFEPGAVLVTKEPIEKKPESLPEPSEEAKTDNSEQEAPKEDSVSTKVNINTAGMQELMTLPGIGERRAAAILDYRGSKGSFQRIEDLMNVKGIGTGIFNKINELICVK